MSATLLQTCSSHLKPRTRSARSFTTATHRKRLGAKSLMSSPKATPQQVAGFVSAAQETLCVQAYTPLQPGGDY